MRQTSLFLALVLLLCISFLFHEPFVKGQSKTICGPLYPRVLGGSNGGTYIYSMDQYEQTTVVGGYTMESALTGGTLSNVALGFIAQYLNDAMLPSWVKSLTLQSVVHGIALNPATKWIIAHTGWVSPYYLLILDSDGNLKGAYTYKESPSDY